VTASGDAHWPQNRLPAGFSVPHEAHVTDWDPGRVENWFPGIYARQCNQDTGVFIAAGQAAR